MIQRYVRDGKEAQADDPPENVWVQVKFLKTTVIPVDSGTNQVTKDSPFYDANGLAISPHLRRPADDKPEVTMKLGDTAVIKQEKFEELSKDGVCEKVATVYGRPLNDYKHHFHRILTRMDLLDNRIAEVNRQIVSVMESKKQLDAINEILTDTKDKLKVDKAGFENEVKGLKGYVAKLEAFINATRQRARELHAQSGKSRRKSPPTKRLYRCH